MLSKEPQWVAVYTNPRAEKKVEQTLHEAGYVAYLPLRRELHTWSDRKKWVEVPLLKSYVFVRIKDTQLDPLRAINGIAFVISFKGSVATIPEYEIQMMKDFLAAEIDVQVRTVEQLRRGRKVRIHSGPLAGKEGVLVSDCKEGNFAVEITGISMAMVIHVDRDLMEPLPDEKEAKQKKKKQKYTIR